MASFVRRSAAGVAGALAVVLMTAWPTPTTPATATSAPIGVETDVAAGFARPPAADRPMTRWWWTCGEISRAEIEEELAEIAAAGFGGVEILCVAALNPVRDGWGSATMRDRMQHALDTGERLGLRVDFTVGPAWPLVVPGVLPDSPAAAQELAYGSLPVAGGALYVGPAPAAPPPSPGVVKQTLVAAHAVRCVATCAETDRPVRLVAGSVVDLTADAADGLITWRAPATGSWLLLGYWRRGTGQTTIAGGPVMNAVEPAYVVDHFSRAGAHAAVDYWNRAILTEPMRAGLLRAGGDLFEDSLELDATLHWTADLLEEFERRRGYDLRPYLSVLMIEGLHTQYSPVTVDDPPDHVQEPALDRRVRHDYFQTLTDLYVEEHVGVLKEFANDLGLRYRAQPYNETTEVSQVGLSIDAPETEGLVPAITSPSTYRLDQYRIQAGTVHLGNKPTLSTECCAVANAAYAHPLDDLVRRFATGFAAGINRVVLHGYAYANGNAMGAWPGYSPFTIAGAGNGFSEAWGPRQATWDDMPLVTDWLARLQYLTRQGTPRVDVAVYREDMDRHLRANITDRGLARAGYSYDYVGPSLLTLPTSSVADRRLAPEGPGYRALVLDEQPALAVATARRLVEYARAGLPVVVVGAPPSRTPGAHDVARADSEVARLMAELLAQPSVRRVASESELAEALAAAGVRADLGPVEPGPLLAAHRRTDTDDIYIVHNPSTEQVSTRLDLAGSGAPARLDPWTGEVALLGEWQARDGRTSVDVSLAPGELVVVAVGSLGGRASRPHVTASEADVSVGPDRDLLLTSSRAGTFASTLPNGRVVTTTIKDVPGARRLDRWQLTVSDWHRGPDGRLEKTEHQRELTSLAPWSQIAGLEDVSGVGTYTTTVDLAASWTGGLHARLALGEVFDTYRVRVNGRPVAPADQTGSTVDVSSYLQPGANTIEVRVATTLRNRLRVTPGFPGQTLEPRQDYGLIGPVRLVPYGTAKLAP